MKRIKAAAILLLTVIIIVGCGNGGDISYIEDHEFSSRPPVDFAFSEIRFDEAEKTAEAFAVIGDDKLAVLTAGESGTFAVYENGKVISRSEIPDCYREICYNAAEDCFYTYDAQNRQLHIMDNGFNFKEVLADDLDVYEVKNMDVVDNKLYLTAIQEDISELYGQEGAADEKTGYTDLGETVYSIDLTTKETVNLGFKNVICQSFSDNTLYYYSCRGGHYSLDIYDREANALKAVKNTDGIGYISAFAVLGEEIWYISPECYGQLKKTNLNSGETASEAGEFFVGRNSDFEVYKGSLICLNRANTSIVRCGAAPINEKLTQTENDKLVIGYFSSDIPFRTSSLAKDCGISASVCALPMYDSEIKLKLLACDSDVDIYIFSTARRTGIDIRRMGCYVPLTNDAILDKRSGYFDYLSDYSVNDNGEIWCMPISVSADATFYVPDNLKALGIEPESLSDFDGYFAALEKVNAQDTYKIYSSTLDFTDAMNRSYNVNHGYLDYDNELYRNMFERLFSGWVIWSDPREGRSEHPLFNDRATAMMTGVSTDVLEAENMAFTIASSELLLNKIKKPGDWRAMPLPALTAGGKNPVTVDYAIINPYSKKKEAAEAYLGFIAENGLKYTDKSLLYKDKSVYGDYTDTLSSCFDGLYGLFENGAVYERHIQMEEDYREDVIAYQNGEVTLDEYIAELERAAEMSEYE